jgi:hypothetical protein
VIDQNGLFSNLYRVRGVPSSYFIARDGTIKQIVYGPLTDSNLQTGLAEIEQP